MAAGCPRILRDSALAMSLGQFWVRIAELFESNDMIRITFRFDYGVKIA